jgi:hypothetical protein
MIYICEHAKTCEAIGYCFHAREHEKLPVSAVYGKLKRCDEIHLCTVKQIDVVCKEVVCP